MKNCFDFLRFSSRAATMHKLTSILGVTNFSCTLKNGWTTHNSMEQLLSESTSVPRSQHFCECRADVSTMCSVLADIEGRPRAWNWTLATDVQSKWAFKYIKFVLPVQHEIWHLTRQIIVVSHHIYEQYWKVYERFSHTFIVSFCIFMAPLRLCISEFYAFLNLSKWLALINSEAFVDVKFKVNCSFKRGEWLSSGERSGRVDLQSWRFHVATTTRVKSLFRICELFIWVWHHCRDSRFSFSFIISQVSRRLHSCLNF